MPENNLELPSPDPFIMNEDTVNECVAYYLINLGFDNVQYLSGRQHGIDVSATKNGYIIQVESKGSQANHHDSVTVFDSGQIVSHLGQQILKLMQLRNRQNSGRIILVMANPNIPRIRNRVEDICISLNDLSIVRFWVNKDTTIDVDYPVQLRDALRNLEFISSNTQS